MAMHEDLVDLSLFATSPTSEYHFGTMDSPSRTNTAFYAQSYTEPQDHSQDFSSQRHTGSHLPTDFDLPAQTTAAFDFGFQSPRQTRYETSLDDPPFERPIRSLPRSYSLKPLPPLPPKKLCKPRPSRPRADLQSRCILQRLKKTRSVDATTSRRDPLQQRRQMTSAPQLTLTVPQSTHRSRNPSPEMIWLPEEQMWLVTNHRRSEGQHSPPMYTAPVFSRGQPSPSVYQDPTPPLTPDPSHPRNPLIDDDGLSPIQSQFRSLIVDAERRSPLFQEAMQTIEDVNPMHPSSQENHGTEDDGWPLDDEGWPIYDPRMYETPPQTPIQSPPHFSALYPLAQHGQRHEADDDEDEDPISPATPPQTPLSTFDEIEREWNSAVSVYSSISNSTSAHENMDAEDNSSSSSLQRQSHSRDTSDQSYYSAMSTVSFAKGEDPVDFYLGVGGPGIGTGIPLWRGIARSISSQTSRS